MGTIEPHAILLDVVCRGVCLHIFASKLADIFFSYTFDYFSCYRLLFLFGFGELHFHYALLTLTYAVYLLQPMLSAEHVKTGFLQLD